MAYLEAYIVWEGTADQDRTFRGANVAYDRWARRAVAAGKKEGASVQVYSIYHEHPMDGEECSCVQYLMDHSPDYSTDDA